MEGLSNILANDSTATGFHGTSTRHKAYVGAVGHRHFVGNLAEITRIHFPPKFYIPAIVNWNGGKHVFKMAGRKFVRTCTASHCVHDAMAMMDDAGNTLE